MSVEENKAAQRRVWEEVFNKGNLGIIPELFAPNYVSHESGAKGPEGFKQALTMARNAFPDFHCIIDDMLAEGDKVVTRYTMTGTHKGEYMGVAPTGKKFSIPAVVLAHFKGDKQVEAWPYMDALTWYRQLGIPIPTQ